MERRHEPEAVTDLASSLARAVLALGHLASGDAASCVEQIVDACGGTELPVLNPRDRAQAYEALVQAELARARTDAADGWAQRAEANAAGLGRAAPTGFALLSRARILAARDPAGAAQRALAAAEAFTKVDLPLEEGRARLLAGTALAATDDRARALEQLARAEALFADRGAHRLAERAVREQRWLETHGDAVSVLLPLSGRELEVAQLVALGHTNHQIANRLRLSNKTVETYLSRIFNKLGVSSRAVVAAMITRAQIPA